MPPAAMPLTMFWREANVTAMRPRMMSQKKSGGVKARSISSASGSRAASTTMLNRVPSPDAVAARPMARPPSPRRVIGKPSNVVHTLAIVPGVLSRMAGTAPPVLAVPMIPAKTYIATMGSQPNVNGRISVMAMTLPRPGITPNRTPRGRAQDDGPDDGGLGHAAEPAEERIEHRLADPPGPTGPGTCGGRCRCTG